VTAGHKLVRFSRAEMSENLPDEVDFSKLVPIIGRGLYAADTSGERPPKAKYVVVDDASLVMTLDDGRKVMAPLAWYPRLRHATPVERNDWRTIMGGRAVLWKSLGLGVSVKALLDGTKAGESAASLKKWLANRVPSRRRKSA